MGGEDGLLNFALNMKLLIGLLVGLAVLLLSVVALWTGLKIVLFRRRLAAEEQAARQRRYTPDGQRRPPVAPGICDSCHGSSPEIHYLPDGRKLCAACWSAEDATR